VTPSHEQQSLPSFQVSIFERESSQLNDAEYEKENNPLNWSNAMLCSWEHSSAEEEEKVDDNENDEVN
jgi:hypothetical protein